MRGDLGKNVVIAASLLAAGFLAAWLRFRPHLGNEGAFTDGERTIEFASSQALRYAVWDRPEPYGGELNSGESERGPSVSPDGQQVVFVVGERGLGTDLWVADLEAGGRAIDPRPLVEVNGPGDELAPAFAPDGTLLFASNRAGGAGGFDLWRAPWSRGVFGAPEWIDGGLNTAADELDPAPVPGSDELVLASNRRVLEGGEVERGATTDLWRAWTLPPRDGERAPRYVAEPLAELNTAFDERDPCFTPDGRALLFASDRAGEQRADFDLYRASRAPRGAASGEEPREWLDARPLVGVNTAASERDPRPAADGFALLFTREATAPGGAVDPAPTATFDVWRARSSEIVRTPGRPIGWRELLILVSLLVLALLAALAKRWRGLDILYKAFLVSLLIHLLLLAWSREVVPTSEPVELDGAGEQRVRIRLLEDPNSLSAQRNQERGGSVQASRASEQASEALAEATPARSESEARDVDTEAPTSRAIERAAAELAAAPALEPSEAPARPEATASDAAVRTAEVEIDRRSADARALEVSASADAEAAERATESLAEAAVDAGALRAETSALESAAASTSGVASPVERAASASSAAAPAAREARVERSAAAAAASPAAELARPTAEVGRRVADARAMEVRASDGSALDRSESASSSASAPRAADAARSAQSSILGATGLSPSASSRLERASSARGLLADAPAPSRAPAPERAGQASASGRRSVDVAGLAAPERAESAGPPAPAYDPAADMAPAGAPLARRADAAPPGGAPAFGAPGRRAPSTAGAPAPLRPGSAAALSLAGAPRRATGPAPAPGDAPGFQPSARGARDVALAAPEVVPGTRAGTTGAPTAASTSGVAAGDLAVAASGPSLERTRGAGAPGPTRFAGGPAVDRRPAAPAPGRYAIAAPAAPKADVRAPLPEPLAGQWERTPYQSRSGSRKIAALEEYGGSAATEAAVERGLEYLAARQRRDGRWGTREVDNKYGQPMIGKTGLCLLAFMGAGHTPDSATRYSELVAKGLDFLVASQDPETGHIGATNAYGHAIATYALGEAFALTGARELKRPLVRATARIVEAQVGSADPLEHGGWTYYFGGLHRPRRGTVDRRWPRVSVSVWQVMALESARLGGIEVKDVVFDRARSFLVNAWDRRRGAFRYSHDPSRLGSEYSTLPGSTPAALFALSLLGVDVAEGQFAPARSFVSSRAPDGYRFTTNDDFVFRAQGNQYFWYYGTLAMFRAGGDDWQRWNAQMKATLLPAQEENGSWEPISIYADFAQDTDADRSYTTAMNVLALEVYYRYFTPLLKVD